MTTDSVYFVRNPQCNNYNAGTPLPPPTTPAPGSPPPANKLNPLEVRLYHFPPLISSSLSKRSLQQLC